MLLLAILEHLVVPAWLNHPEDLELLAAQLVKKLSATSLRGLPHGSLSNIARHLEVSRRSVSTYVQKDAEAAEEGLSPALWVVDVIGILEGAEGHALTPAKIRTELAARGREVALQALVNHLEMYSELGLLKKAGRRYHLAERYARFVSADVSRTHMGESSRAALNGLYDVLLAAECGADNTWIGNVSGEWCKATLNNCISGIKQDVTKRILAAEEEDQRRRSSEGGETVTFKIVIAVGPPSRGPHTQELRHGIKPSPT